jgi:hypothetical protein
MHCRATLSDEFVVENVKRTPEYVALRAGLLFGVQQAQMPGTQETVRAYMAAKKRQAEVKQLIAEMRVDVNRRWTEIHDGPKRGLHSRLDKHAMSDEVRILERIEYIVLPGVAQCIKALGIGWERWNFDLMFQRLPPQEEAAEVARVFIKACPVEKCHGFLGVDFVCALCGGKVCDGCHEILVGSAERHSCDPVTVASVKAIVAESRPCPQCGAAISKVDGCDQMWCTQCHTTFSWRTGAKEEGTTHNPHYYEWMRRSGLVIPRAPGGGGGGGCAPSRFPSWGQIYKCFSDSVRKEYDVLRKGIGLYKDFHAKYPKHAGLLAGHIRPPVLKTFLEPLPGMVHYYLAFTALNFMLISMRDNAKHLREEPLEVWFRKYRIRYMANEISIEEFKRHLVGGEFEHMRRRVLYSIHTMVFRAAADVLTEFLLSGHNLGDCHDTYTQIQRLLMYANECLDKAVTVFGTAEDVVKYPRNVYDLAT